MPYKRDYALNMVDEVHEKTKSIWQLEKEQRIKPSLWWREVAQSQQAQSSNNQAPQTPELSNLSADGKAWFIHPITLINQFNGVKILFRKGDKHEIIREINIRLAGFGGNLPTDEFTERTENMIKQFQRDYMLVEETGVVDMEVIEAIDEFQEKYSVRTFLEEAKCPCSSLIKSNACSGFGQGNYKEQKQNKKISEMYRKYEYPGIHRTLFWVLRTIMFYIENDGQYNNLKLDCVYSGYRCWKNNNYYKRYSTNHMGKAFDIHIFKKGKAKNIHTANERIDCCDLVRDLLTDKTNAEYRWFHKNGIGLENSEKKYHPTKGKDKSNIASTWVHYDVRTFELEYLEDQYFAISEKDVNGTKMKELIMSRN